MNLGFRVAVVVDSVSSVVDRGLKLKILDTDVFWVRNEKFRNLLAPVLTALRRIESDQSNLADFVDKTLDGGFKIVNLGFRVAVVLDSVNSVVDKGLKLKILDTEVLWVRNEKFRNLLAPVLTALRRIERDQSNLADFVDR